MNHVRRKLFETYLIESVSWLDQTCLLLGNEAVPQEVSDQLHEALRHVKQAMITIGLPRPYWLSDTEKLPALE